MSSSDPLAREAVLLDHLARNPDATQASLAAQLGVAVGTVNWYLKRFVAKGWVKVKRVRGRKLRYVLTPEGMALRARLTVAYVERSMRLYRETRAQVRTLLEQVREAGWSAVRLEGQGDLADVCRLTCLEQGVKITEEPRAPALRVEGLRVTLVWPGPSAVEERP